MGARSTFMVPLLVLLRARTRGVGPGRMQNLTKSQSLSHFWHRAPEKIQIDGECLCTPPKFNIAPEKWWLEDYFPIGKATFQGLC